MEKRMIDDSERILLEKYRVVYLIKQNIKDNNVTVLLPIEYVVDSMLEDVA